MRFAPSCCGRIGATVLWRLARWQAREMRAMLGKLDPTSVEPQVPYPGMANEDEHFAVLDPFLDQIEWMSRAFEISMLPFNSFSLGSLRVVTVRRHLAIHVMTHGQLPIGSARIRATYDDEPDKHAFEVDFDALATEAARACLRLPLPDIYRLPRRKRPNFYRQHIEAIGRCVELKPDLAPQGSKPRSCFRLLW